MSEYVPTIGLEIHAELNTKTKMFCCSKNDADEERPNVNVCPVCLAHPGTLPVINREAVHQVLRVGTALSGQLADYTEFDRKNYFYPDLPKGYQLSQYEFPLVSGGTLNGVAITRVHLEEDTASSMHDDDTGATTIDFNRAGVPLMELVTEPVMHSAKDSGDFARELQLLLRNLGASNANMEKGEMRVEANISVAPKGKLGTKVEIKNLNSFRAMERAVEYEIKRQTALLEKGEVVLQQTLGWDDGKQATFVQRIKEGSADYRYFPDPDLPSLKLSEQQGFDAATLQASLPELPGARRMRYSALGLKKDDMELFVGEPVLGAFFDRVTTNGTDKQFSLLAANFIANDLVKIIRDIEGRDSGYQSEIPISVHNFASIVRMASEGRVSSRVAKDLLLVYTKGESSLPTAYAESKGLLQTSDTSALSGAIDAAITGNPAVVADYRAGKAAALEYLVGQCMKALRGSGNPAALRKLLQEKLA